jgi:hypothetical protein
MVTMSKTLLAYRSPDNRCRTEVYLANEKKRFCLGEKTRSGALVTEFETSGVVLDQVHYKNAPVEESLAARLGVELSIAEVPAYERIRVAAACSKCNADKITRELDLVGGLLPEEVPVIPIFRCIGCGQRHYSMGREYLEALVKRNEGLFEEAEIAERNKDEKLFVNTLNEYVIRIFASKKISRLVIKE